MIKFIAYFFAAFLLFLIAYGIGTLFSFNWMWVYVYYAHIFFIGLIEIEDD